MLKKNRRDYQRRRKEEKVKNWKGKSPSWRVFSTNFRCVWRGVLVGDGSGAQGNRRLYPRCTRASFKNNSDKHSINKTPETSLGRLCGDSTETVRHIVSGCSKLAQREYRKHQDKVAPQVHWELCR